MLFLMKYLKIIMKDNTQSLLSGGMSVILSPDTSIISGSLSHLILSVVSCLTSIFCFSVNKEDTLGAIIF